MDRGDSGDGVRLGAFAAFGSRGSANTFASGDYPKSRQVDYKVGLFPFAEYSLTETFSIRTVIGKLWQQRRSMADGKRFLGHDVWQTAGLGISVTKATGKDWQATRMLTLAAFAP